MKIVLLLLTLVWSLLLFPYSTEATESNQFVTIVNPVRMPLWTNNPIPTLQSQYDEVQKRGLAATWLLTYDILLHKDTISFLQVLDKKQELGLFLEVFPELTKDAGVVYNKTDSWHRANSLFLIGYTQDDRIKLIDTAFNKFKDQFGYYPTSVGAWWIDSYSLNYMQKKYNITANLGLADQLYTDNYNVWGQYWSTPFYPNKLHAGLPANKLENKLNLVTLQWAPRDPLNGFTGERTSLYSTQDYPILGLKDDYFEKLIRSYVGKNKDSFGQMTVGLEGDLYPNNYKGHYASQLDVVSRLVKEGEVQAVSMSDFSKWYIQTFPQLSPVQVIITEDLLGKKVKSIWYQSPQYRINLNYDEVSLETKIFDLRIFPSNFQEPFYNQVNQQLNLLIETPAIIDAARDRQSVWAVAGEKLQSVSRLNNSLELRFVNGGLIKLEPDRFIIQAINEVVPGSLKKSPVIKIEQLSDRLIVTPVLQWPVESGGYLFRQLIPERPIFLVRQRYILITSFLTLIIVTVVGKLFTSKLPSYIKRIIIAVLVILLVVPVLTYQLFVKQYYVSQSELDALYRLRSLSEGKVLVWDQDCPRCQWASQYKPAVYANKRDYISWIAQKPIVYNQEIFTTASRKDGRKRLDELQIKYIYLAKYDIYEEKMPFSPGDYKVEMIFENANAQVWRVDETDLRLQREQD